jgi:hypothetical protein
VKPRLIAVWSAGAALTAALAACGGGSGGSTPATPAAPSSSAPVSSSAPATASGGGALTPPGTRLGFGQSATVAWVPPGQSGNGAQQGFKLKVMVQSIQKGTIGDFKNIELNATEKKDTPYYVKVKVSALQNALPAKTDDPAITFTAIDDRGQSQESITFLGTFSRCDEVDAPKPFTAGKSYESCFTYLMPGGGSIQKVQWSSGPSAADQVTPYFDKPVVWAG